MATAICNNPDCKHEFRWKAGRGCSIKSIRCPKCQSEVHGPTAGMKGSNTGRKMEICIVCGKKAFIFLHPAEPYKLEHPPYGQGPEGKEKIYPAGSACCWSEWPMPANWDMGKFLKLKFRSKEYFDMYNRRQEFLVTAGARPEKPMTPLNPQRSFTITEEPFGTGKESEHFITLRDRLNNSTPVNASEPVPERKIPDPKLAPCRRNPRGPCPDGQNHFVPKPPAKEQSIHGDRCDLSCIEVAQLYLDECPIEQHARLKGLPVEKFRPASELRECPR